MQKVDVPVPLTVSTVREKRKAPPISPIAEKIRKVDVPVPLTVSTVSKKRKAPPISPIAEKIHKVDVPVPLTVSTVCEKRKAPPISPIPEKIHKVDVPVPLTVSPVDTRQTLKFILFNSSSVKCTGQFSLPLLCDACNKLMENSRNCQRIVIINKTSDNVIHAINLFTLRRLSAFIKGKRKFLQTCSITIDELTPNSQCLSFLEFFLKYFRKYLIYRRGNKNLHVYWDINKWSSVVSYFDNLLTSKEKLECLRKWM
nr:PREDICTED: uncharacterized protein LOC109030668 isoform X4 [Bemisia tabaci]